MSYYWINLMEKSVKTYLCDEIELMEDAEIAGVRDPRDLSDWELRVFKGKKDADNFATKYQDIMKNMKKFTKCNDRSLPNLLFKKRYIALTLIGVKFHTKRKGERLKNAEVGELINLYDQTHFHTVRLTAKKKISDNEFRYDFEKI